MNQKFSNYYNNFQNEISGTGKPGFSSVGQIIDRLLPYLFGIAGLILLLYLVWGGFMFMTSHGDQKAVENARQKITSAIIGFVIIFVAYWLVQLLGKVFGLGDFRLLFKP